MIKLLEESVINKIAAGEVIERPASVIKELVENAIDAKANSITVEVDEGGKSRIKVIDDGTGMGKSDAELCIQRHATSKIEFADDLFNIHTLGFRGEGLASIVAVAQVVLKTKTKEQETGIKITASGGKILKKEDVAIQNGTSVEVSDLFFNVPARKKHLKTMQTELRQITELITRYALAYPEKMFRLMHHGNDLLFSPSAEPLDNLLTIFGKNAAYAMIPVEYTQKDITVKGFVGNPTLTRADKTMQHIFVNRRPIKNDVIVKAVTDAYHTLLHLERQPVFVLNVDIKPAIIDVNVHPQKTTIRIEKENELYDTLFNAVRNSLDSSKLIPVVESRETFIQAPLIAKNIEEEKQTVFEQVEQTPQDILEKAIQKMTEEKAVEVKPVAVPKPETKASEKISKLKLIGCVHDVFYIAQNELGLVIIDQHAAHERVMYEKLMQQFGDGKIAVQELLEPEQIDFSPTEMLLLKENIETLSELGFVFDEFGGNTMLLRTVPFIFGKNMPKEVVHDVLAQLGEKSNALDQIKEEKIIRSACRAAVKARDVVHENEMKKILDDLRLCRQPFTCPHGRPTMIQFTVPELEKKFKRVV